MITKEQSHQIFNNMLKEAKQLNAPDWVFNSFPIHVHNTALVAEQIAKASNLDPEKAYAMGMLHDLGKADEVILKRFHGLMGYERLKDIDQDVANICITHMFLNNDSSRVHENLRMFYDHKDDIDFVVNYLNSHPAHDYDLLIQLSDGLSGPEGLLTIEERMHEYNKRHKLNRTPEEMKKRIQYRLSIKKYFEEKNNCDIYEILGLKNHDQSKHLSPKYDRNNRF